jgi:MerR family transcriptional regulator, thiopeptide resistance regulator
LLATVDKTIRNFKGERQMKIKDYYQGFSETEIEKMRSEVKEKYGENALNESEAKVTKLSKAEFARVQAEGETIWKTVAGLMAKGPESREVQAQIDKWRLWLANFYDYSDEMLLGLGRMYSADERFAANFRKYDKDMPQFATKAIEFYVKQRQAKKK